MSVTYFEVHNMLVQIHNWEMDLVCQKEATEIWS